MNTEELQKQTNTNIQEKANLIWEIATHLYGEYKPHEYGRVILPMTVIKRFDDALKDTKSEVVAAAKQLDDRGVEGIAREAILKEVAKHDFYNTSKFDFASLTADSDNITANFTAYLQGFSDNVKDIISRFEFDKEIQKMSENDLLFTIITEFNSKKADMSPDHVTSQDMGYIFEELIRKFSESYDEQAGAHFTARDIIYLMTDLLIAPEREEIKTNGCAKTAYDMAMGTSQMLACLGERLKALNPESNLKCFGQEFNPETFAIAKADMLIKGGDADNMKFGDTLSNDQFTDYKFDYIISNPPFGIDWKKEEAAVETEAKLGFDGRFGPGLPQISDGQMLFLMNGVKKLKDNGRMAIIQNSSSLFTGDAGSGPSEMRKYIIENDMLEAIVQLPIDLFYNTGIATYIWVVVAKNGKSKQRKGTVQLIDATNCFSKRRKNIGDKRADLSENCINLILKAYLSYENASFEDFDNGSSESPISVESKIFPNAFFGYTEVAVETAQKDGSGQLILKKGSKVAIKGETEYEKIPLTISQNEYLQENVLPFNPDAFVNEKKMQIGYEIPFSGVFYKYSKPQDPNALFEDLRKLQAKESSLMEELLTDGKQND
jgi:type I restriction enzyme M protein